MATMVKEKREKKKTPKEKHKPKLEQLASLASNLSLEDSQTTNETITNIFDNTTNVLEDIRVKDNEENVSLGDAQSNSKQIINIVENKSSVLEDIRIKEKVENETENRNINQDINKEKSEITLEATNLYGEAESNEENTANRNCTENMCNNLSLSSINAQGMAEPQLEVVLAQKQDGVKILEQNVLPSAPELVEAIPIVPVLQTVEQKSMERVKPKIACMDLEEAVRVYGGKEIVEVKAMSEREEALVEAGPVSGSEHPLVDLLSTFRLSLIAVERERAQISCNITEEEKTRLQLWKVQKRSVYVSEKCKCGANVEFKAVFDQAELLKEKLPVARMRLEALIRDVQESYCHHQHAALLAHCQIEDFISETVQSNKSEIREALFLILQALRLSDGAVGAYTHALQRWASALSAALVDERDLRQLLFLLHHLFRQTRSVRWAARVVRAPASAARTLALLDLLLARPALDCALECTEELEAWEEVDVRGGAGAVGDGRLRERDLLALLDALPMQSLFARLALFPRSDIRTGSPVEWGDASGGHGVLKSCCGVRALLDVFSRASHAHAPYTRLHAKLRALTSKLLHALAALHLHSSPLYMQDLRPKIQAELQACFEAGFHLMRNELDQLPTSLLSGDAARHYCITFMLGLHDKSPRSVETLTIEAPVLPCEVRIRIITQAAVDRTTDHELARNVLEFLLQTGIARKANTGACTGECEQSARAQLPRLLAAHRSLHTAAFCVLPDFNLTEPVDSSFIKHLCPEEWRPNPIEIRSVLDDWTQRCPQHIQHLLLQLQYMPHVGVSLETQLTIGSWLCDWVRQSGSEVEWSWSVIRRINVHRTCWGLPLDAPPPDEPIDNMSTAYALLASAWGHCIPLACGPGAEALCRLATARPVEALHCAGPLMRVMALSPESVSYTPKFTEAFSVLLNTGPSLVQRAFGRGGLSGAERLQQLVLSQLTENRFPETSSLLSAWLHALWKLSLPATSRGILDAAIRASLHWATLDAHATTLLQEENSKEYIADAIRNAATAPLLCEAILRSAHANEVRTLMHARLLDALWRQKCASQRIHVDNALKQMNAFITADELVIHRTASALLVVPYTHPAHLTLWRLFFHIYLQRPPSSPQESTAPIGPLFFSGLVKSRVLSQLKKRLQDTAAYHQQQTELLKTSPQTDTPPERPTRSRKTSPVVDNNVFPSLRIEDLTGERFNDSGSDGEEEETSNNNDGRTEVEQEPSPQDTFNMICYHSAAEKLIRMYAHWLEEGEKVRAAPHHADTARFVPEQALDAAWRASIPQIPPDTPTSPAVAPQQDFASVHTTQSHYERAVQIILSVKDNSHRRPRRPSINSPLRNVNFQDLRSLLALVDKLLGEIQKLSQNWSSEVRYISKLDAQLWDLVGALRVRRPLPPVSKSCPQSCKPITVRIPEEEWCLSTGAEQGINENRRSARVALRRLARARPDAAATAAALHCIARRVRNAESALRVVERAGRYAESAECCIIAKEALTTLVTNLAERWVCHDGAQCASLVRSWGGGGGGGGVGGARQALCAALVSPRRLRPADWPALYISILNSDLPPHAIFSYLSKFEMGRWSESADVSQRREVLDALVAAARKLGVSPGDQHQVLLELLGVHASSVVTPIELCAYVCACARACVARALSPAFCATLARAADAHAPHVPFDKLGHLQRELGVIWWEARTSNGTPTTYAIYAEHVAALLRSLQRAFVVAAVALSYEPAAVGWYAWSSIRESWGPWITPHSSPPLLPSTGEEEAYTFMLTRFVETINLVMEQCPGSEEALLRQVWEWTVSSFLSLQQQRSTQESRVQLSALLGELTSLPWQLQWFHLDCLQPALQAVAVGDKEMNTWLGRSWRGIVASTWIRGATHDSIAPALAALLALLASAQAQHEPQTLLEACKLPWERLPETALDEALDRFFIDHYNPALPYHDAPQFMVVLSASQLCVPPGGAARVSAAAREAREARAARAARGCGVSRWVRAAAVPGLAAHARAHAASVLAAVSALAPYIENSPGELEELLSRAMTIFCMDAATAALPVWEQWVSSCGVRLRLACASALAALTALEYFAALAEAVAKAHLADKESGGWSELSVRWSSCPWAECGMLAGRGKLHAAYAMLLARPHSGQLRAAFSALAAASGRFLENEAIVAVWICVACGYAFAPHTDDESRECADSARALLSRWGTEQRRSILQVVSLQASADSPTPQHRLLCKFAQCVTNPNSEEAIRAYEATCTSVLGSTPGDLLTWGRNPYPRRLPRLAMRLYPNCEIYFREELQRAPESMIPVSSSAT